MASEIQSVSPTPVLYAINEEVVQTRRIFNRPSNREVEKRARIRRRVEVTQPDLVEKRFTSRGSARIQARAHHRSISTVSEPRALARLLRGRMIDPETGERATRPTSRLSGANYQVEKGRYRNVNFRRMSVREGKNLRRRRIQARKKIGYSRPGMRKTLQDSTSE